MDFLQKEERQLEPQKPQEILQKKECLLKKEERQRARRSLCTTSSTTTTTTATPDYVTPSNANLAKHYLDPSKFKTIETEAAKGQSAVIEKLIDELGPERFEELTKDIADRTPQDEIKNFAPKNTVLSRDEKFDLANDYSVVKGPEIFLFLSN